MTVRRAACLLVLIAMLACIHLGAGEAPEAAASTPAVEGGSLLANETKRYVAQLTEQRNQMREENETLRSRQGLLLVYGTLLTLLAGWMMFRALGRRPATGKQDEPGTNPFPVATAVTARKNATITIRNGSTQKAEVTEKLQTRRAFARTESGQTERITRTEPVNNATALQHQRVTSSTKRPISDRIVAPELEPNRTGLQPTLLAAGTNGGTATTKRPTVRVEQSTSDRLEPVEVTVKPGTGSQTKPRP